MRRGASLFFAFSLFAATGAARADLGGTQPGELTNDGNFLDPDFACNNCHGGGYMGDKTFLPFDTWAGTMMANSARDPVFYAALAVANQDAPGSGELCLRCHSPIGFVRGHTQPTDGSAFDDLDRQGVSCEACHRATQSPLPEGPYLLSDAQMVYDNDQGKRGKYADAQSPAHSIVVDTGVQEARFCGQCHSVTNPDTTLIDNAGVDTGLEFPFETTFQEWLASDFAVAGSPVEATCQKCHMPAKVGDHPLTKLGPPLRTDPGQHTFVGGNHWGIRAVMEANPDRVALYGEQFELAKQNTLDFLPTSAKVTLESAPAEVTPGATFDVTVRVENLTGHKFPTGYVDSRRAWVAVTLVDDNQNERTLLGAYDAATGDIQSDPPTHVYLAQHGRWNGVSGEVEHSMMKQDMLLVDTRIPPKGLIADITTAPTAEIDYDDGQGGLRSYDLATFSVTAPPDVYGVQSISARVYYQSMTREYIDFLQAENTTDAKGDELAAIYAATDEGPPILVASAESPVDFGPDPNPGVGGGGGATATTSVGAGGDPQTGQGGATGEGGAAATPTGDDTGCSCRAGGRRAPLGGGAFAIALLSLLRRRRASRAGN